MYIKYRAEGKDEEPWKASLLPSPILCGMKNKKIRHPEWYKILDPRNRNVALVIIEIIRAIEAHFNK